MIFVPRLPAPEVLHSEVIKREYEKMREYFSTPVLDRGSSKYKPRPLPSALKERLAVDFKEKCAYCETGLPLGLGVVDRFRPRSGTYFGDNYSDNHYWWLAFEWDNLYYVCPTCNSHKRNKFPILGEPAVVGATGSALGQEMPLLLDPCDDSPEEDLIFHEDGTVSSDDMGGQVTISLLALNRAPLVQRRREVLEEFKYLLESLLQFVRTSTTDIRANAVIRPIEDAVSPSSEYSATKRQYLKRWITERPNLKSWLSAETHTFLERATIPASYTENVDRRPEPYANENQSYDLSKKENLSNYYFQEHLIWRVTIYNFRSIGFIDIQLPVGEKVEVPWLMLLGENGTGKSSMLQAIALCLMGSDFRKKYKGRTMANYLKRGTDSGFVRVYLTNIDEPFEIRFSKDDQDFTHGNTRQRVLLLGYGATRLQPDENHNSPGISIARMDNLFDPYIPLANAQESLYSLSAHDFFYVRGALETLLMFNAGDSIHKGNNPNEILVTTNGVTVPLQDLSDGYQSVVGITTDIMVTMKEFWKDNEDAQGIVFIDELDAHLHPQWKLQIVSTLRSIFPRIQFIVSTHDPLCLRGLTRMEVAVLKRRGKREITVINDLPETDGYEIDQILTSEYFGLYSTVSSRYNEWMKEYYRLLSIRKSERTEEHDKLVSDVKQKLDAHELLGQTPREQLVYRVLDEFIAQRESANRLSLNELDPQTKNELLDILRSYDF